MRVIICGIAALLVAVLVVAGTGLIFWAGPSLKVARESANWPTAQGRILSSEKTYVTSSTTSTSNSSTVAGGTTRKSWTSYRPSISYSYTVDGSEYESTRLELGSIDMGRTDEYLEDFPEGKEVTVHYNPEDPEQAVLIAGADATFYVLITLGFLAIGLAILIVFVTIFICRAIGRRARARSEGA